MNATDPQPIWEPLTDQMPANSIGALEYDLGDPTRQTIVAGIGHFSSYGLVGSNLTGLMISTDAGDTWTAISPPQLQGRSVSGVRKNGNLIVVAAHPFSAGGGVYRSTDNGATWTFVSGTAGLQTGGAFDLVHDPTNLNRLYVSIRRRGIFRSDDFGATWTNVSAGDPATERRHDQRRE